MSQHLPGSASQYPLLTKDPVTGEELLVTRLENKRRGLVLEGEFALGWVGKLSFEQLEFAGLLLRFRGNVQRLADALGVSYNTARARLDAIVEALEADVPQNDDVLAQLERGEIGFEEALARVKRG
jgi:hypothetical protein